MNFCAIDVETANSDLASICQIGIVSYSNGKLEREWKSFVDPDDFFDPANESIHGITSSMVKNAPTLEKCYSELKTLLEGRIVTHHTGFDRVAIRRAAEKYQLPAIECQWLDTAKVVRRTWAECSARGYGLAAVAGMLGISFKHHDALEDARAAAEIFLRAIDKSGIDIDEWLIRVQGPVSPRSTNSKSYNHESVAQAGNPNGPLFGEVVVFTGRLSLIRAEAAAIAAEAGCEVDDRVTKATTLLVVGDQDIRLLNGRDKSSKHRRAEELLHKGQEIRILTQSDFRRLVSLSD